MRAGLIRSFPPQAETLFADIRHYIFILPSSAQLQLNWAELALFSIHPAAGRPPGIVAKKLLRKLKFRIKASFNPTSRNIKNKIGITCHKTVIASQ
jgi:hypothetical protein